MIGRRCYVQRLGMDPVYVFVYSSPSWFARGGHVEHDIYDRIDRRLQREGENGRETERKTEKETRGRGYRIVFGFRRAT